MCVGLGQAHLLFSNRPNVMWRRSGVRCIVGFLVLLNESRLLESCAAVFGESVELRWESSTFDSCGR